MSLYEIEPLGYVDYPAALLPGPVQPDATLSPGELFVVIPSSGGGDTSYTLVQAAPASTWSFPNASGKMCDVDVFVGGEKVIADVQVSALTIAVSFGTPQAGHLIVQPTTTSF